MKFPALPCNACQMLAPGKIVAFCFGVGFMLMATQGSGQTNEYKGLEATPALTASTSISRDLRENRESSAFAAFSAEQNSDSASPNFNQKAKAAALKSAIVPGWGQFENDQVWKVPILYAGLGICAYAISFNHQNYKEYAKAYRLRTDGDSTTVDKFDPSTDGGVISSPEVLRDSREFYRRNRTLSYIATVFVYTANILDAYVFAHLKEFDISDDLSLKVNPPNFANIAHRNHVTMGISLKLKP